MSWLVDLAEKPVTLYPYVIPRLPSFIFGEMIVLGYHTFTFQDLYFMNFLLYKTPLTTCIDWEKVVKRD